MDRLISRLLCCDACVGNFSYYCIWSEIFPYWWLVTYLLRVEILMKWIEKSDTLWNKMRWGMEWYTCGKLLSWYIWGLERFLKDCCLFKLVFFPLFLWGCYCKPWVEYCFTFRLLLSWLFSPIRYWHSIHPHTFISWTWEVKLWYLRVLYENVTPL